VTGNVAKCKIYSADLMGMVLYEHDEYFQSKKWGGTLRCMPPALKKMRRHVPPCLSGIASYGAT